MSCIWDDAYVALATMHNKTVNIQRPQQGATQKQCSWVPRHSSSHYYYSRVQCIQEVLDWASVMGSNGWYFNWLLLSESTWWRFRLLFEVVCDHVDFSNYKCDTNNNYQLRVSRFYIGKSIGARCHIIRGFTVPVAEESFPSPLLS